MSEPGWRIRPGRPGDRDLLASFVCADPAVTWQAEVEQFIRTQLIDWAFDPHAADGDPRLLLAFTAAGDMFGVAAHERVTRRRLAQPGPARNARRRDRSRGRYPLAAGNPGRSGRSFPDRFRAAGSGLDDRGVALHSRGRRSSRRRGRVHQADGTWQLPRALVCHQRRSRSRCAVADQGRIPGCRRSPGAAYRRPDHLAVQRIGAG